MLVLRLTALSLIMLCLILPSRETAAAVAANRTIKCSKFPHAEIITCPENEEFLCCGVCQQLTCVVPNYAVNCNTCPSTCYCKPGYIRRQVGAECILAQDCPKPRPDLSMDEQVLSIFGAL